LAGRSPSELEEKNRIYGEQVCFVFDSQFEALDPDVTSPFAFDPASLEAQVRPYLKSVEVI